MPVFTFSNPTPIIGSAGPASPYPSPITVLGVPSPVTKISVQLFGLKHQSDLSELAILLVAPDQTTNLVLMSNVAFNQAAQPPVHITIADGGAIMPQSSFLINDAIYQPTSYQAVFDFPNSGAPPPPAVKKFPTMIGSSTFENIFIDTNTAVNGIWYLYLTDISGTATGQISNGWSISFTAPNIPCPCPHPCPRRRSRRHRSSPAQCKSRTYCCHQVC